jgi:hypothetical protein
VPDIARLRRTEPWRKPYSFIGVGGTDLGAQMAFARLTMTSDVVRHLSRHDVHARACEVNGEPGYGPIEAQFLYGFIRTHRPARVVQIGCGVSTAVVLAAARDGEYQPEIVCIDPWPSPFLVRAASEEAIRLVVEPVESANWDALFALEAGSLLFVDSTHTLGPAGEVSRIVLEVLPRLQPGVRVHFHDIYFPYDYSPDLLATALFFQHESSLLHAFLVGNARFSILASLSMLHHGCSSDLAPLLPGYSPRPFQDGLEAGTGHFPSALYLEVAA